MGVRDAVFQDLLDVLASIVEDELVAAGMVEQEACNVVNLVAESDITVPLSIVSLDLGASEFSESFGSHFAVLSRDANGRTGMKWRR